METITEFIHLPFDRLVPKVEQYSSLHELMKTELVKDFQTSEGFYRFSVKSESNQTILFAEFDNGFYKRKVGTCSSSRFLDTIPIAKDCEYSLSPKVIRRIRKTSMSITNNFPNETILRIFDVHDSKRVANDRSLIGSIYYDSYQNPPTDPFWLWQKVEDGICEFNIHSSKKNISVEVISVEDNDLSSIMIWNVR